MMSQIVREGMIYSAVTNNQIDHRPFSGVEDFKWHRESVMLLISLYRSKKSQFVSGFVKKRDLWSEVASQMSSQGFVVNLIACEKKWHNLCATYRKLKECSLKKQNCWSYFQPLQELLENNFGPTLEKMNTNALANENNCGMVKLEPSNSTDVPQYGINTWAPVSYHPQMRSAASEGESGSCDQDISNMLSVTIEENIDRSQVHRENMLIPNSAHMQHNSEDFKWTHESVMILCSLYIARKEQFLSGTVKKRDLWTDIAQEMSREGFSVTCVLCEKKWHNLIATYKKVTLCSRKRTWPYLHIFQKIIEEQAMRAASTGFSDHYNYVNGYAKDFSENPLCRRYLDKDGTMLTPDEPGLFGDHLNRNPEIIPDEFKWTHDSVITLCSMYKDKRVDFQSNAVRKRDLWTDIAGEMNSQGYNVTWVHCEKKWYNLYATYKKVIDQNRKRVRIWSTWPYLKLFQDIFSADSPPPPYVHSKVDNDLTLHQPVCSPVSSNSDHTADITHDNIQSSKGPYENPQSSKGPYVIRDAPDWFLEYCQQQKEMEDGRQLDAERRHRELLEAISVGNNALLELSSSLKVFLSRSMDLERAGDCPMSS